MSEPDTAAGAGPGRVRLRVKFLLTLLVAALVPVSVAATVVTSLVVRNLENGVEAQTRQSMEVALNLVLRHVKDVFEAASRIADSPRLLVGLDRDPDSLDSALAVLSGELPAGVIEIADIDGRILARHNDRRGFEAALVKDGADLVRRALGYERRISIEVAAGPAGPFILVRAAMPIVDDEDLRLRGAVILTVPLDAEFADELKAELAADVVFYVAGAAAPEGERALTPTVSSFLGRDGQRRPGFPAPRRALDEVATARASVGQVDYEGRPFAVGLAPLRDRDGVLLGALAVAAADEHLIQARARARRALEAGAAVAALLALFLSGLLSRTLTGPLARLTEAARAVARGDLETAIERESGDEIGDLAEALRAMTRSVRFNQDRLAARIREINTIHEIGRTVSSVLRIDDVLRRVVAELSQVLGADRAALLFAGESGLRVAAAVQMDDTFALREFCQLLYWWDGPLLIPDIDAVPEIAATAAEAGMRGSLLAVPVEQKDDILGLLLVHRDRPPFGDDDLRLVATFADHAATAIANARLYDAVQRSSEELERKVEERTRELTAANRELARLLDELRQAQAQLVLSERMAGLGVLVAGVAHEINSPAGAIQGAIDAIGDNVERIVARARALGEMAMKDEDRNDFLELVARVTPRLAQARVEAPAAVRRASRELAARMAAAGLAGVEAPCRVLADLGATDLAEALLPLARTYGLSPLVGYLEQHAYLHRNIHAIRTAIARVRRIVGALKGYSHLDQAKIAPADIHEGIENTLIILHHELSHGIVIHRRFADLPLVPAYVDELNQVWTNLLQNAAQALSGQGEIVIETRLDGDSVEVAVQDNGPGIPDAIIGRIFEPFFTTKKPGQGTGLGLGIARQIVDKHGGRIDVASRPGCTRFTVRLPVAGPPAQAAPGEARVGAL